jgi:hypothetical protein
MSGFSNTQQIGGEIFRQLSAKKEQSLSHKNSATSSSKKDIQFHLPLLSSHTQGSDKTTVVFGSQSSPRR